MLHQIQRTVSLLHRRYGVRDKSSIHNEDYPYTPKTQWSDLFPLKDMTSKLLPLASSDNNTQTQVRFPEGNEDRTSRATN